MLKEQSSTSAFQECRSQTVVENFQLDDTKSGHSKLFNVLGQLLDPHPRSTVFAAVESTG